MNHTVLRQAQIARCLVVLNGSPADDRALDIAFELAHYPSGSLRALLLQGEFRAYSTSTDELRRWHAAWHERFVGHAFRLSDRAYGQGLRLPIDLIEGGRHSWLRGWIEDEGFDLVVVAHEQRAYLPMSLVARVRRWATCPVVAVK